MVTLWASGHQRVPTSQEVIISTANREQRHRHGIAGVVGDEAAAYDHGEGQPLGSYTGLMAAYGVAVLGVGAVVARRDALPERLAWTDLALVGVATFKLSRLLTKEIVTSPLRAPVTRYEGKIGAGEVMESPRGSGLRRALGDLAVCPFCASQWSATGFVTGLLLAPRATRVVMGTLAAVAAADVANLAYSMLHEAAE